MIVKDALSGILSIDQMRSIVSDYEIDCDDRRSRSSLWESINSSIIKEEELVEYLSEVQVKDLCNAIGVDSKGRKKQLLDRLLNKHSSVPRTTQSSGTNEIGEVSSDSLTSLENIINNLLAQSLLKIGPINFGFCGACKKKHPKQWFDYVNIQNKSFYLCRIKDSTIVERYGPIDNSTYTNIKINDFVEDNKDNSVINESVEHPNNDSEKNETIGFISRLTSFIKKKEVQQSARTVFKLVTIVSVPPFAQIAAVGDAVLEHYMSKNAS